MKNLARVNEFRLKLYPKDFNVVREFYENILGYSVTKEWDRGAADKGVMFDAGSVTIELLSPEGEHQALRGVGLSLEVQDVIALFHQLKDRTNVIFEPRHNEWGDTSFRVTDPEGLNLTFFTKD